MVVDESSLAVVVFKNPGWKSESRGDAVGVAIEAAEAKVDGVAESLAVLDPRTEYFTF